MYIITHKVGPYVQWDLPLLICFSPNMNACREYCVFLRCNLPRSIKMKHKIFWYFLFFFTCQVKDDCFHWWARFLLLSRLQQYIVLMVRDHYRPDACLYSAKGEDLAWGCFYSSFSDGAKWALLSTIDSWHHSAKFYFKATKHESKMQIITLKKTFNMWSSFLFFFLLFICLFFPP